MYTGTFHLNASLHSATCHEALDKLFTSLRLSYLLCKLEICSNTGSMNPKGINWKEVLRSLIPHLLGLEEVVLAFIFMAIITGSQNLYLTAQERGHGMQPLNK